MQNLRIKYILFQVFFSLLLWVPIFYEFQKLIGLDESEIFRIQSYYYLAFILFEIPTGYLSDRFGHRNCLVAGAFLLTAANLIPVFQPNYLGMFIHFAGIAAARSLVSGAASAHLYEGLGLTNQSSEYKAIEGEARTWSLIAKLIGWVFVGQLLSWNINFPYLVTAGFSLLATISALSFVPLTKNMDVDWQNPFSGMLTATRELFSNQKLTLYMLQGTIIFVFVRVIQVNLYQPILIEKEFSILYFGALMSAMTFFEAIGSKTSLLLRNYFKDAAAVAFVTVLVCFLVIFVGMMNQIYLTVIIFCLFSLLVGLAFPIQKQLLNDHIGLDMPRATILSLDSIISRAMCALVVWPMGGLIEQGKLNIVLMALGFTAILLVLLVNWRLKSQQQ